MFPKEKLWEEVTVTSEKPEDVPEEKEQPEAVPSEELVIASEPKPLSHDAARVEVQVQL